MKVQVLQENLIKALNIASRSISTKAQLPVLANILLSAEKNRLKIAATNLEMGVVIWVGAKVDQEGSITLPSKIFQEFVSSLPAEKIDLSLKENTLSVESGSFNASFNGISATEFPLLPVGEKKVFSFPTQVLEEVINQVAFASATDEGRPILTGVLLKKEGQFLSFAATDGYRLSLKKIKLEKEEKESELKSLVIPAKTLIEVGRIITDQAKKENSLIEMSLTKDENQAVFNFPDIEISTRLLEGEFPDYEKIIPSESVSKISLDKEEFVKVVRLASIFARDSSNIIKFKFSDGKLSVSANSPQVGENFSQIEAKIEGDGGEIAFNYRFLLDFLSSVVAKEVVFEMSGSLNPGVFKLKEDISFLHVVMPIRLQS